MRRGWAALRAVDPVELAVDAQPAGLSAAQIPRMIAMASPVARTAWPGSSRGPPMAATASQNAPAAATASVPEPMFLQSQLRRLRSAEYRVGQRARIS